MIGALQQTGEVAVELEIFRHDLIVRQIGKNCKYQLVTRKV